MQQSQRADRSKRGGTTGQGAGKAAAHKVLRDGQFKIAGLYPLLLEKYKVGDVSMVIAEQLNSERCGLLEGSQGALLSLNHGYYPFCCAKDVTPAGILTETGAGIKVGEWIEEGEYWILRIPLQSGTDRIKELEDLLSELKQSHQHYLEHDKEIIDKISALEE